MVLKQQESVLNKIAQCLSKCSFLRMAWWAHGEKVRKKKERKVSFPTINQRVGHTKRNMLQTTLTWI